MGPVVRAPRPVGLRHLRRQPEVLGDDARGARSARPPTLAPATGATAYTTAITTNGAPYTTATTTNGAPYTTATTTNGASTGKYR